MKKIINFFKTHQIITLIITSFLLGVITVFISSTVSSFLYDGYSAVEVVDSNFFYMLGKMLHEGKTPYLEVFDHKGLYMFYYTFLGVALGGKVAFFFIQSIFMAVTYFFIIRALLELQAHKSVIVFAVLIFLGIYAVSYYSPNDAEPQLPVSAVMVFFYARAMRSENKKAYLLGNLFAGILAGIAFNIRPSDMMVPFAFVLCYLVYAIKHKCFKDLLFNALIAIGGLVVALAPAFIHAYSGGFLKEMFEATLLNNFSYVGAAQKDPVIQWTARAVVILVFGGYFAMLFINRKKLLGDEFIYFLVIGGVLFILQLLIAYYTHYLLATFTVLFVFIPYLISKFFKEEKKWMLIPKITALLFAVACSLVYPIKYYSQLKPATLEIVREVNLFVDETSKKNGAVLCVDTNPGIYLAAGITPGYGDFSIQFNHVQVSKLYSYENYLEYLKSGKCKFVITEKNAAEGNKKTTSWFKSAEGLIYYAKIESAELKLIDIYTYL